MKNNLETLHAKRGLQKAIMAATDLLLSAPQSILVPCHSTAAAALKIPFYSAQFTTPTQHPKNAFNRLSNDCHADVELVKISICY